MDISKNFSLKQYNTFGISAMAKEFVAVHSVEELAQVLKNNKGRKLFILGGGSNMLLTQDIEALVIHVALKGREVVTQDDTYVYIKGMAGENWHEFVLYCIAKNYGGLENM